MHKLNNFKYTSDESRLRCSRRWVVLLLLNATNQSTKTCQKTNKTNFCAFFLQIMQELRPPKRYSGLSRPPNADPISPSCSVMSILHA
jgi:hypothetical protein